MQLRDVIQQFAPISLKEMDSVQLLDRTDTKFTFRIQDLPAILALVKNDYYLLEINGKRSTHYETLYFDTPDLSFYQTHHNEKMNRYKARFRRYVESNLSFFEVKFKSNKERTVKDRHIVEKIDPHLQTSERDLFEKVTKLSSENLTPTLWVNYERMTFVSKAHDERLTIDTHLEFIKPSAGESVDKADLHQLVIAEVKQSRVSYKAPFMKIMRQRHMRTLSISKYCVGINLLFSNIKYNNFKPKMLTIKKLNYGTN